MYKRWLWILLAAGCVGIPDAAWAQRSQIQQPQLRDDEQILPSQIVQPPPKARAAPTASAATSSEQNAPSAQPKPSLASLPSAGKPEPTRTVTCGGTFAKNASHLKLAALFGVQNIEFTEVNSDTDAGSLMATVLYPKDPKRRLEVLWDDDASRSGTSLIVIGGQSTWTAPKGLHLGVTLAALEKLNGKPFRLKGFDKSDLGQVSDWGGGALANLPGGCKLGVQLRPDPKASADARGAVPSDMEFSSGDAAMKAVKPTVGEIILGY